MRGCDETTVQQLLNELGRKKQELAGGLAKLHEQFGWAFMSSGELGPGAKQQAAKIHEVYEEIDRLNDLASSVESETGLLRDRREKELVAGPSGQRDVPLPRVFFGVSLSVHRSRL
jgi:hypothetical protein